MEPVTTIDCHYGRPERAAAYLLIDSGRAALIDNNTVHAIPHILAAIEREGLSPDDVQYLIPTHLHLDHAGATSALTKICKRATVISHPRGVRHYVDPSRLITGVKAVYGESDFARLFGAIEPIATERVRAVEGDEQLKIGNRTLRVLHTRGHANHAISIHDSESNGVFTGDTFGVEYRASRISQKPFFFCSTAPTDFDPAETRASVARILALRPDCLYLAHFGRMGDIAGGAAVFLHFVEKMEALIAKVAASPLQGDDLFASCMDEMRAAITEQFEYCGVNVTEDELYSRDLHLHINAQGIAYAAEKIRAGR